MVSGSTVIGRLVCFPAGGDEDSGREVTGLFLAALCPLPSHLPLHILSFTLFPSSPLLPPLPPPSHPLPTQEELINIRAGPNIPKEIDAVRKQMK